MKLSKEIKEQLEDQANQIIYFEAAMYDENQAYLSVLDRITAIYKAGVNNASID